VEVQAVTAAAVLAGVDPEAVAVPAALAAE
jgi:hypothetical protein